MRTGLDRPMIDVIMGGEGLSAWALAPTMGSFRLPEPRAGDGVVGEAPAIRRLPCLSGEGRNPGMAWKRERKFWQALLDSGFRRKDGGGRRKDGGRAPEGRRPGAGRTEAGRRKDGGRAPEGRGLSPERLGWAPEGRGMSMERRGWAPEGRGMSMERRGWAPEGRGMSMERLGWGREGRGWAGAFIFVAMAGMLRDWGCGAGGCGILQLRART